MEHIELVIFCGMIVSTLLLWFIQHVNNNVCATNAKIAQMEETVSLLTCNKPDTKKNENKKYESDSTTININEDDK